jgi:hypothetical protein
MHLEMTAYPDFWDNYDQLNDYDLSTNMPIAFYL